MSSVREAGGGDAIQLVVATGNAHKLDEIRAILDGLPVALISMAELDVPSPVEDGETFAANALLKARACAAATGLAAIADDSGLVVDALEGAPGVYSARYAGATGERAEVDAANNAKLVAALAEVSAERRTARFVCAAALVEPVAPGAGRHRVAPGAGRHRVAPGAGRHRAGVEVVEHGEMTGRVVLEARGEHGFGYDPHFVAAATADGRTNGELAPSEKDAISHRGAAFRALRAHLEPR